MIHKVMKSIKFIFLSTESIFDTTAEEKSYAVLTSDGNFSYSQLQILIALQTQLHHMFLLLNAVTA